MAQPVLLGLFSTSSGRTMTELLGVKVLRKNPHQPIVSIAGAFVQHTSAGTQEFLHSTAEPGMEGKPGLQPQFQSNVPTPSHQVQLNRLLLQNKFSHFTAPRLQHLTSTENSSMLPSAVRSR